ncbi:MAG: mercury(II) reductase [bacterium]
MIDITDTTTKTITIKISGMTCDGCASHARDALNAIEGVVATVSYPRGIATVRMHQPVNSSTLLDAIVAVGYEGEMVSDEEAARLHIAIVGTGSGAFAAAIKAAESGARVTLIEGADVIGGTCVNVGCVPSKIMIRGASVAHLQARHNVEGIEPREPIIDRRAMVAQQQDWVDKLRHAKYESILESHPDISLIRGMARFIDSLTLEVRDQAGETQSITADRFLLAVGARPNIPDIPGLSDTPYWTSTEALVATTLPRHLIVLGGSVVALELAQAFSHLGVRVTLIARSTLLSRESAKTGATLESIFEEEGIRVILHTVPDKVSHNGEHFKVQLGATTLSSDQLLVATGRQSNADTLALDQAGVQCTKTHKVIINDRMQTNIEHIYAAGDCTSQPQFVYVAAAAGTRAARNMMGEDVPLDLSVLPAVVFTSPQVATVGLSEDQAYQQGLTVETRTLTLDNVPRAIANLDTRGFITLVAETGSGRLVGCQTVAAEAGEIIQTAALAIRHGMSTEALAADLFPYLTMVEGLKLCAQTFHKDVSQLSCCAG